MSDGPNLGTCCACEGTKNVRNVCCLHRKSPTPGRGGWGCLQCHLPSEGAVAVLCDACLESKAEIKWACRGYPAEDGRVLISELTGSHDHDLSLHPELREEPPGEEPEEPHPLAGAVSTCERCECCTSTWSLCEECEGEGLISIFGGMIQIECPSCEGYDGYWLCARGCDEYGEHHEVKP